MPTACIHVVQRSAVSADPAIRLIVETPPVSVRRCWINVVFKPNTRHWFSLICMSVTMITGGGPQILMGVTYRSCRRRWTCPSRPDRCHRWRRDWRRTRWCSRHTWVRWTPGHSHTGKIPACSHMYPHVHTAIKNLRTNTEKITLTTLKFVCINHMGFFQFEIIKK